MAYLCLSKPMNARNLRGEAPDHILSPNREELTAEAAIMAFATKKCSAGFWRQAMSSQAAKERG